MPTLQSLTGKYREIQGKPCNVNRDPAMRTGFPCNESRFFPVGIDLQGKAVRERPLMTSDFRVGRGVQNDPKNRTF